MHPKSRNVQGESLSLMFLYLYASCLWLNSFEAKAMLHITHINQPHLPFVSELHLIYSSHCWTFMVLDDFSSLTQQAINNYCLSTLDKQLWKSRGKGGGGEVGCLPGWLVGFCLFHLFFWQLHIKRGEASWTWTQEDTWNLDQMRCKTQSNKLCLTLIN